VFERTSIYSIAYTYICVFVPHYTRVLFCILGVYFIAQINDDAADDDDFDDGKTVKMQTRKANLLRRLLRSFSKYSDQDDVYESFRSLVCQNNTFHCTLHACPSVVT